MPSCPGWWAHPSRESYFQNRSRSGLTYNGLKPMSRRAISLRKRAKRVERMIRDRLIRIPRLLIFTISSSVSFSGLPRQIRSSQFIAHLSIDPQLEWPVGSQYPGHRVEEARPVIRAIVNGDIRPLVSLGSGLALRVGRLTISRTGRGCRTLKSGCCWN